MASLLHCTRCCSANVTQFAVQRTLDMSGCSKQLGWPGRLGILNVVASGWRMQDSTTTFACFRVSLDAIDWCHSPPRSAVSHRHSSRIGGRPARLHALRTSGRAPSSAVGDPPQVAVVSQTERELICDDSSVGSKTTANAFLPRVLDPGGHVITLWSAGLLSSRTSGVVSKRLPQSLPIHKDTGSSPTTCGAQTSYASYASSLSAASCGSFRRRPSAQYVV